MALTSHPPTPEQRQAQGRNARRSTGPRTPAGKQRASLNALKHGLYARSLAASLRVLGEDRRDLLRLLAELLDAHQPADAAERLLVEDLTALRAQRLRMERALAGVQGSNLERLEAQRRRRSQELQNESADVGREAVRERGLLRAPDSPAKFSELLAVLDAMRAQVESGDFRTDWGPFLETLYGKDPTLRGVRISSLYEALADPEKLRWEPGANPPGPAPGALGPVRGKVGALRGSFAPCAGHVRVPAVLPREFPRLIKADAEARLLRRPERPKELVSDEVVVHSPAVVLDLDDRLPVLGAQAHVDPPVLVHGFDGVLNEVSDHRGEPIGIGGHGQPVVLAVQDQLRLHGSSLADDPPQQGRKLDGPRRRDALAVGLELQQQAIHLSDRVLDGADHVRLESGILPVLGDVRHHQGQLAHDALYIMYDEGEPPVEGVELLGFHQSLGGLLLGQVACGLAGDRLQQVVVLPVELPRGARLFEDHEADQAVAVHERDHQPEAHRSGEGFGQHLRRGRIVGIVSVRNVKPVPRERWGEARVADVMAPLSPENSIRPDANALDALQLMTRTGNSRLVVVAGSALVGIVALKDLMNYLFLKLELEDREAGASGGPFAEP